MPETPRETPGNPRTTDEWLARISGQLAGLQSTADRFETTLGEFVPGVRALVGKRTARAAAAASTLFQKGRIDGHH